MTAADGSASTFDAMPVEQGCLSEGTAFWDGPDAAGLAAADLGPAPFTYRVDLVLDGARHVATARWPDDQIVGNELRHGCARCGATSRDSSAALTTSMRDWTTTSWPPS